MNKIYQSETRREFANFIDALNAEISKARAVFQQRAMLAVDGNHPMAHPKKEYE